MEFHVATYELICQSCLSISPTMRGRFMWTEERPFPTKRAELLPLLDRFVEPTCHGCGKSDKWVVAKVDSSEGAEVWTQVRFTVTADGKQLSGNLESTDGLSRAMMGDLFDTVKEAFDKGNATFATDSNLSQSGAGFVAVDFLHEEPYTRVPVLHLININRSAMMQTLRAYLVDAINSR